MNKYSFRFLWVGQSFASLGDVLYVVALITMLYEATGSATYTAMVAFLRCFSNLISGFVAPLILDRFPLRSLLVCALTFSFAWIHIPLVELAFATFGISAVLMAGLADLLGVQYALTVSAGLYASCSVIAICNKSLLLSASKI